LFKTIASTAIMGVIAFFTSRFYGVPEMLKQRFLAVLLPILLGSIAYFLCGVVLRLPEVRQLFAVISRQAEK
jgi:hypothetical protein